MASYVAGSLDSSVAGSTYAVGSGSNRIVVFMCVAESNTTETNRTVTSLTWNSLSVATFVARHSNDFGNTRATTEIWYVKEADIQGSGNVEVTWDGTVAATRTAAITLQDCKQDDPTNTASGDSGNDTNVTTVAAGITAENLSVVVNNVIMDYNASQAGQAWSDATNLYFGNISTTSAYAASYIESTGAAYTNSYSWDQAVDANMLAVEFFDVNYSGGTTYPQNRGRLIGTGTIGQGNGFGYKRF